MLGPDDTVLSDELNHASIIDGIRLCKAKKNRYKHRDMEGRIYGLFKKIINVSANLYNFFYLIIFH